MKTSGGTRLPADTKIAWRNNKGMSQARTIPYLSFLETGAGLEPAPKKFTNKVIVRGRPIGPSGSTEHKYHLTSSDNE